MSEKRIIGLDFHVAFGFQLALLREHLHSNAWNRQLHPTKQEMRASLDMRALRHVDRLIGYLDGIVLRDHVQGLNVDDIRFRNGFSKIYSNHVDEDFYKNVYNDGKEADD